MDVSIQANVMSKSINNNSQDVQQQNAIEDLKMEYKIKYERLVKLHQDLLEAFATGSKSAEVHQNASQSYIKELKNSGFEKDMRIYHLEEELTNLDAKYKDLQNKYNQLETKALQVEEDSSKTFHCSDSSEQSTDLSRFAVTMKTPVVETPITLLSIPKIDLASPLLLPETPCRVSKQKRISVISETLDKATPTDEKERHAFLKNIILEQKELLDFYATITGFAAWKDKLDASANDSQFSLDFFKMKPQKEDVQDMELQFIVDYDVDDIEYRPLRLPTGIEESLDKIAPYMKDSLYFSSENAPKLLRSLLEVINS